MKGVRLLKRKKVKITKDEIYLHLAETYGWTFEQIANMNSYQQMRAYNGPTKVTFSTPEEYANWLKSK